MLPGEEWGYCLEVNELNMAGLPCRARASDEKDMDDAYQQQQEVLKRRRSNSWEAVGFACFLSLMKH